MSWFKHRHYWRLKSDNVIRNEGVLTAQQLVEDCSCGAVRTIEIAPGKPPVIRMAEEVQG